MNSRKLSHAEDISPYSRKGWTVLVRVLERHPICISRGDIPVTYRRYLLSDMKDVKVSAVVYGSDIAYFEQFLLPTKKYLISNATVRHVKQHFQTENYRYSWTVSKSTLVEPFTEPESSKVPVMFDFKKFAELVQVADLDIPITMKLLVLAAFPVEPVGSKSSVRDFVVINEEKIPMMLRMWKELHETDGEKIVASFPKPTVVVAMNLKVTTFHGIALCTRYNTCFIHNPPEEDGEPLGKWYEANSELVDALLEKRVYRDVSGYILPPKSSQIMKIAEAYDTIETIQTAWIRGKATLIPAQDQVVYTICSHCYKSLRAETGWSITCTRCGEDTKVKFRCHLELFLSDGSAVLETEMYSPYADQLVGMAAEDMYAAQESGVAIEPILEKNIESKEIVCLVKFFDKEFRGKRKRKFVVVRMFHPSEVTIEAQLALEAGEEKDVDVNMDLLTANNKKNSATGGVDEQKWSASSAVIVSTGLPAGETVIEGAIAVSSEKQFFSPRTRQIIDEMENDKKQEMSEVGQGSGVKRALNFGGANAEVNVPAACTSNLGESGTMAMAERLTVAAESPGKKKKNHDKLKQS